MWRKVLITELGYNVRILIGNSDDGSVMNLMPRKGIRAGQARLVELYAASRKHQSSYPDCRKRKKI